MSSLHVLAFDLGASCGRSMLAAYDGQRMRLQEINRFPHTFSILGDQAYWDVLYLMDHIREGLRKCDAPLKSIGVDTWGVDFGLLDKNGQLLAMPRSYRDEAFSDTNMTEALEFLGGAAWLFEQTGIANINYNSVFKLYHMKKTNEVLDTAETFLMMPNLIEYFLSGVKHNEYSVVSTSQLYDMEHRDWARPVLEKLGLPLNWFTPVDRAGAALGPLSPRVARETGKEKIQVISTAGHDTACAAAAVPAKGDEYTFLSSGTWSLLGIASRKMLKGEAVAQSGISNEGAWDGGYRPTVNISGLWILQECRRQWANEGYDYSFDELQQMAGQAPVLRSFIRPEDFEKKGDYPGMIRSFCRETGQSVPETHGEITRCVYESLAMKYRQVYRNFRPYITWQDCMYVVGGGARDTLLNQFTADALGFQVVTGPTEATSVGNILVQLEAMGEVKGHDQRREVIADSFEEHTFAPKDHVAWQEAYERFERMYEDMP